MSATTPLPTSAARPGSRPGSRPTTPLRRSNSRPGIRQVSSESFPLNALEPQFAELSDEMATLEANFADLREMHDSISRFNENFAAFLYGLNLNAYCVDFPEAPVGPESFARVARKEAESARESEGEALFGFAGATPSRREYDVETTFMTTDTSFVHEPPAAKTPGSQKAPTRRPPAVRGGRGGKARGGSGIPKGRGSGSGFSYR